jgi:hypothetical protein
MAGLPHYNNSRASTGKFEPVQGNLFEVTFFPPAGVAGQAILLEHVNTVGGLAALNPTIEAVGQKYKFSDRSYAGMPGQTFVDVAINFSLNLNDANQNYVYKTLRDWYKKIYDPATGAMGLKKDYTGSVVIVMFDRQGNIHRKVTLLDTFPTGSLAAFDTLDYNSPEPLVLDVTWRSDNWIDENN